MLWGGRLTSCGLSAALFYTTVLEKGNFFGSAECWGERVCWSNVAAVVASPQLRPGLRFTDLCSLSFPV